MPAGLYLHIPFCRRKCPYCDFYSVAAGADAAASYTSALCRALERFGAGTDEVFDSVYFGGGTPNLLSADNLARVLDTARRCLRLEAPEVTCEANPESADDDFLRGAVAAGVDRFSFGLQSSDAEELALLGRRHTVADVVRVCESAARFGCGNVSLDLMAALPGQTAETLTRSIGFAASLPITHLSAYLLKVEPGTPFAAHGVTPPDDDAAADLYNVLCDAAEACGFAQYEISNFARPGYESRHNTKYWNLDPYLGLGPAAHSFFGGRRFRYPRDLAAWTGGTLPEPVDDGAGGGLDEYLMLRLRLTAGVPADGLLAKYGVSPCDYARLASRLTPLVSHGLMVADDRRFALTRAGFLVSNSAIGFVRDAAETVGLL